MFSLNKSRIKWEYSAEPLPYLSFSSLLHPMNFIQDWTIYWTKLMVHLLCDVSVLLNSVAELLNSFSNARLFFLEIFPLVSTQLEWYWFLVDIFLVYISCNHVVLCYSAKHWQMAFLIGTNAYGFYVFQDSDNVTIVQ